MNKNMAEVLKNYSVEELVRIMEEECDRLEIQYEKNGKPTEWKGLSYEDINTAYWEWYDKCRKKKKKMQNVFSWTNLGTS